jgi:hypothetical protein
MHTLMWCFRLVQQHKTVSNNNNSSNNTHTPGELRLVRLVAPL